MSWKKSYETKICPFENGEYYEIGFLNADDTFVHQGIRQYHDGFLDDDISYWLKPFPTHYKKINLSPNPTNE